MFTLQLWLYAPYVDDDGDPGDVLVVGRHKLALERFIRCGLIILLRLEDDGPPSARKIPYPEWNNARNIHSHWRCGAGSI